jgi:predicted MarR family transcription regulator
MVTTLKTMAFRSPIGRKVKAFIATYDDMGCGILAQDSVIDYLLDILVRKDYISEHKDLIPATYYITTKGTRQLERRDQVSSALLADVVASRRSKARVARDAQEIEDLLESIDD